MTQQVDAQSVIDELKGQRNTLADQLAVAGALITTQQKRIEQLEAQVKEKETTDGTEPNPAAT